MSDFSPDWETKIAFMRAKCLTSAKWDPGGSLTEAVCGPEVTPPTEEEIERETQPSPSPQERERLERQKRRDVVARSSGGPVPRLDVHD